MTREETKTAIKIMQHYAEGGEIEYRHNDPLHSQWEVLYVPNWDWLDCEYRIKPDKKKRLIHVEELPFPCLVKLHNCDTVRLSEICFHDGLQYISIAGNSGGPESIDSLAKRKAQWAAPCARLQDAVWHSFEVSE